MFFKRYFLNCVFTYRIDDIYGIASRFEIEPVQRFPVHTRLRIKNITVDTFDVSASGEKHRL